MDAFSTAELAGMQAAQEEGMMDTCVLQTWSSSAQDAFGQRREAWTDGDAIACGFNPKGGREVPGPEQAPILTDATVRLPIDTEVDRRDRVKVTHRFGALLATAQVFEIVQEPRRGPSGLQLDLRKAAL